ncbi:hypothetical protein ACFR9U_03630 [Halorientalis brevis]|uniref:CopG family transcriptional regulator n=1 Tax=Halorientalis brevis TaxID=1126241 RepID=A0ABD6C9B9_9EURY|nr:hypothetical protein [Halorientalis brevis]
MEIRVELADDLVEELDDEASLQGFDDRAAYLRWIIAHRPMSDLASTQAPAVASRVSELEERVKLLERQLDLDTPTNPEADLGGASSSGASLDAASGTTPESGADDGASLAGGFESKVESAEMDDPQGATGEPEEGAEDDDIADAIGDISLDDDE